MQGYIRSIYICCIMRKVLSLKGTIIGTELVDRRHADKVVWLVNETNKAY